MLLIKKDLFLQQISQLYFIHPFHHREAPPPPRPPPRSPPSVPLFCPFPHLPPASPTVPHLSLSGPQLLFLFTLGCRACSLHRDKPPPAPPLCSCHIIFPPCQLQPREASSLVTRLLLQQQGQTCTRGIDGASCSVPSHRI